MISDKTGSRQTHRIYGIDALRGLAVVFMIGQHVIYWLCSDIHNRGIEAVFGTMGGLAAPIFLTLAGFGSYLASGPFHRPNRTFYYRGLAILGFGYILNAMTPHWFSLGSWYVLHLIGLATVMSPLLKRLSPRGLIVLIMGILVFTVCIQNELNTPLRLYNKQMAASPSGIYDVIRHMLAEGFFPLFPWGSFFVAGFLAGRWFSDKKIKHIYSLSLATFGMSLVLSGVYILEFEFTHSGNWIRVFTVLPTIYPALMPISLLLISMALLFTGGILSFESKVSFRSSNALVCLGRSSLTLLIIHVVVIREAAVRFHFWRTFSIPQSLVATLGILVVFSVMAVAWQRINFRFGAEWLIRRVSG